MELSVTQENLARALTAVARVASSKTGLPILGNILLRTEGTRLLVAATNLEIAATYYVGAKVAKQGELTNVQSNLATTSLASLNKANQLKPTSLRQKMVVHLELKFGQRANLH
jgi:DNA polymerase-3 subunit beta